MFEKVNPGHPDKMADRLAGAVVDLVYERAGGLTKANPRVACEVMAGHGRVDVQIETSLGRMDLRAEDIDPLIRRLFGERVVGNVLIAPQDAHLSDNQTRGLRCGDNGIFKGVPPTYEQRVLTAIAATIYGSIPYDGKYIIGNVFNKEKFDEMTSKIAPLQQRLRDLNSYAGQMLDIVKSEDRQFNKDEQKKWDEYDKEFDKAKEEIRKCLNEREKQMYRQHLTVCQSHLSREQEPELRQMLKEAYNVHLPTINPLGPWTGGIDVDCGCTNRKLGSDMGDGVTGGGLMGKDLSKADVSVNIVCYLKAVASGQTVTACCSIGDERVTFVYADGRRETETFADIVEMARLYIITDCGGSFERFASWGLIRPKE